MIATALDAQSLGISAPQIHSSQQVIVVALPPNPQFPDREVMQPMAVTNPRIRGSSPEIEKKWEACLSIPGIRGLVPRAMTIEVEYLTRRGEQRRAEYSDLLARIVQHEVDHLNGVVFLDRVEDSKDIITEKEYQRILRQEF